VQKPKGSGRWYVVLELPADDSGRRRRQWHSGYATRREAERGLTALLSAQDSGTYTVPQRLTVGRYLAEHWLPAIEGSVRPSTYRSYRLHVTSYLVPGVGAARLQQLMPDQISAFYRRLQESGAASGRGLSPTTVRRVHATLHRALTDAVSWGYLPRNPAAVAVKPKQRAIGSYDFTVWTADELSHFLARERADRLYPLWRLAATTGMRRGELLGLRWSDVDLDAARLSVRQTLTAIGHRLAYGEPKTARGRRNVALDPETVAELRTWRERQYGERTAWGPAWQDSGLVFTREDGSPVHPDTVSYWFDKHLRQAGLPRIRLHDLRHSFASLALQAGVPAKVVSERLGHATVAFTLDVYSHVIPGLHEDAATRVAALLRPPE